MARKPRAHHSEGGEADAVSAPATVDDAILATSAPGTSAPGADAAGPEDAEPEVDNHANPTSSGDKPPASAAPDPAAGVVVTVIGPVKGRRRAGYTFGATPQSIVVSEEQLVAIRADALLAVSYGRPPAGTVNKTTGRLSVEAFAGPDGAIGRVTVIGPAKGRRRAGYLFGAAPQTIAPTREQLERILADPSLSVTA